MKFGLEKESIILDKNLDPYTIDSGFDKNQALDFCDHQLELISDVCDSIEDLHLFMNKLSLKKYPKNGYIWPISPIPCYLKFSLNNPNLSDKQYHQYLSHKYNANMLLTSGIHFNVSEFKSDLIDMIKKIYVFAPIILPFFSFSPKRDSNILSSRNTNKEGYYNEQEFDLDFSSLEAYNKSVDALIANGKIKQKRELYSRVRIKYDSYLELRFIDLNPFYVIGISYEQLKLLETFIIWLDEIEIDDFNFHECVDNFDYVASNGRNLEIELTINGVNQTLKRHILELLENLKQYNPHIITSFIKNFNENNTDFQRCLKEFVKYDEDICLLGEKFIFNYKFFDKHAYDSEFELSTALLVKEAEKHQYDVEILSKSNNVIKINNNLIVKATETNLDKYANVLMLANKEMTKLILEKNNISVPKGIVINTYDETVIKQFINQNIVIKPIDTNFGEGISILKNANLEHITHAIDYGFAYSNQLIIEQFYEGDEFRFLVVNNKCISVVHRIPCNVVGDGFHTIQELINIKNDNPLRGNNYKNPLEKIKIDDEMLLILKEQKLNLDSVLAEDQIVYLRKNSNVSTGGETVEVSDIIPHYFKEQAVLATKSLDVMICGIDMIIPNLYEEKYAIIEANFNPAIHMHTFPLIGYGRNVSKYILDLFKEKQ